MDDFSRLVCLVGWILRMMEKNKRENNIFVYLVREKNGKENWGPKVFSPDPPNCNLLNLKSKWSGKKNPTWRYQITLCNKRSLSLCPKKIFQTLSSHLSYFFCVCVHFSPIFPFICCFLFFFNPFFFLIYLDFCILSLSQWSALHFFNKSIICYFLYLIEAWQ